MRLVRRPSRRRHYIEIDWSTLNPVASCMELRNICVRAWKLETTSSPALIVPKLSRIYEFCICSQAPYIYAMIVRNILYRYTSGSLNDNDSDNPEPLIGWRTYRVIPWSACTFVERGGPDLWR